MNQQDLFETVLECQQIAFEENFLADIVPQDEYYGPNDEFELDVLDESQQQFLQIAQQAASDYKNLLNQEQLSQYEKATPKEKSKAKKKGTTVTNLRKKEVAKKKKVNKNLKSMEKQLKSNARKLRKAA